MSPNFDKWSQFLASMRSTVAKVNSYSRSTLNQAVTLNYSKKIINKLKKTKKRKQIKIVKQKKKTRIFLNYRLEF